MIYEHLPERRRFGSKIKSLTLLVIAVLVTSYLQATTYYVSNNGNDSNNGTSTSSPWRTISKVNSTNLNPGDMVLFRRGDSFNGRIVVDRSGNSSNWITYGAYGSGNKPRIDNNQQHDEAILGSNSSAYIIIENLHIREAKNENIDVDPGCHNWIIQDCYLTENGANDSGSYQTGCIEVDGEDATKTFTIHHITIRNNELKNYHGDGLRIHAVEHLYVRNNDIGTVTDPHHNGDNLHFGSVRHVEVTGNVTTQQGTPGPKGCFVMHTGPAFDDYPACEDVYIADNVFDYGNFGIDVAGFDITIERNLIRYSGVEKNTHWAGAFMWPGNTEKDSDNVIFRYNVIIGAENGIKLTNSSDHKGNEQNYKIYNNTIYDCERYGVDIDRPVPNSEFKNNIVWCPNASNQPYNNDQASHWDVDYNNIGPNDNSPGSNGISTNPDFVNAGAGDFHLQSSSPCIDAGVDVGLNTDYDNSPVPQGSDPDMGAFEFGSGSYCAMPSGLATSNISETGADVSWNSVQDASDYDVRYKTTSSGSWNNQNGISGTSTSLGGLSGCTNYEWQVRANCSSSSSNYTDSENFFTASCTQFTLQAEDVSVGGGNTIDSNHNGHNGSGFVNFSNNGGFVEFTNVDGGSGGNATLTIRWALNSSDRTGDLIINGSAQNLTMENTGAWTNWNTKDITVSMNAGTTNTIRFESTGQDFGNLDEITLQVNQATSAPNAPNNLSATAVLSTQIDLSWNDNSNNEDGFKIERKFGGGSFTEIATVNSDVTTYNDTGLSANTMYTYRVRAYNTAGDSGYTSEASVTTPGGGGLVSHWRLDGNGNDDQGNNDLFNNGAGFSSGIDGQAADLSPNDYFAIDNFNYSSSGINEVTVSAWVNTSNGGDQIIMSFDRNEYFRLEINGDGGGTGQIGWDIMTSNGQLDFGSSARIDDGNWHHVAGVYDNGTASIYIDGVLDNSISQGSSFGSGNTRYGFIGVGSEAGSFDGNQGPAFNFDGMIDDVRLYDVALSSSEIEALFDAFDPGSGGSGLAFEAGTITNDQNTGTWYTQNLTNTYSNPILILGPPSFNGSDPEVMRARNIQSSSFEYQQDEWDYLDGGHIDEDFGYMVMEEGDHTFGGLNTEAGEVSNVTDASTTVNFTQSFSAAPTVLTTVVSDNDNAAITTRIENVSATGFDVRVQEQESSGSHGSETIHYIAIEQGSGSENGIEFESDNTGNIITDAWSTINFGQSFSNTVFLASMQTADGGDPCALRMRNLIGSSVDVFVEEEASADSEIGHISESVGYLVIEAGDSGGSSSRMASVNDDQRLKDKSALQLYPNPSKGVITLTGLTNDDQVVINDILGKQILSRKISGNKSKLVLDLSHESSGLYFITIKQKEQKQVRKLMIE